MRDKSPLWLYPRDPVRLACGRCRRYGAYAKAGLFARMNADTDLSDLKYILTGCHRFYETPCEARFVDAPPAWWTPPAGHYHRQRIRIRDD